MWLQPQHLPWWRKFRWPICTVGGKSRKGAFDDAQKITPSPAFHLHFVAMDDYRRRVVQLGEAPGTSAAEIGLGIDGMLAAAAEQGRAGTIAGFALRCQSAGDLPSGYALEKANPAAQTEKP